ncbi:undecaprenyl-phosphate glucose phosphotransferase [candidate division KSB1 bacterium]|nr:undecaprenyl-phosphate glucose phosphotransferase [candidate division KSB1 bacterium]
MPKPLEKVLLIFIDLITVNIAFFCLLRLRSSADLFVEQGFSIRLQISMIIFVFWFLLFLFFGLYRSWYTKSRFDEVLSVFKAVSFGLLLIFLLTFEPESDLKNPPTLGRLLIFSYWFIMLIFVGGGRLLLHTLQRKLLERGIWQKNTLIIGWNDKAKDLADRIEKYPALGYKVVGFISLSRKEVNDTYKHLSVLGHLSKLEEIVTQYHVEEVIISLGKSSQKSVLTVIANCEHLPVHIKIEPDLYNIILGQARTQQIYGFPLIEIYPELMQPWERQVKRIMDLSISFITLLLLSPLFILVALIIKLESSGPVFFKQKRVGKGGRIFTVYKFRSMVRDAEKMTGPVWAGEKDPRITRFGRIMRKLRIDEFPQLLNVLYGQMSIVGPRPERPYFVDRLKRDYPFYTRRLRVKPGITGWAQVKGEYDTTIEQAKEKLAYDLYYIDNISLSLDLRILFFTVLVVIRGKGQ